LGEPARTAEIADRIKGNDLLSMSFDRMAGHLRANGVSIDGRQGVITLGPWLEIDPQGQTFVKNDAANALRARKQRDGFEVPAIEGEAAAG
jgi:hypothetical protein